MCFTWLVQMVTLGKDMLSKPTLSSATLQTKGRVDHCTRNEYTIPKLMEIEVARTAIQNQVSILPLEMLKKEKPWMQV